MRYRCNRVYYVSITNIEEIKKPCKNKVFYFYMVGVARFELATSRPPDARATKLRYTPKRKLNGEKSLPQLY